MAALDANEAALGTPKGEPVPSVENAAATTVAQAVTAEPAALDAALTATSVEAAPTPGPPAAPVDQAVAALCTPIEEDEPCGPDLDVEGDSGYLNFFAQVEGVLPVSFFSPLDGTPFDRAAVDLAGQLEAVKALLARSRDIRLFLIQARLQILNRDLAGFAVSLAAAAYWLEAFWDQVHPRPEGSDVIARITTVSALDTPTVILPLQYAPLFEAPRLGTISYRRLMIANDEIKPRTGEEKLAASAVTEALGQADPDVLTVTRGRVTLLKSAITRIRNVFTLHAASAELDKLPVLIDKIQAFIDPVAAAADKSDEGDRQAAEDAITAAVQSAGPGPVTLAQASEALAAIAEYYSRLEPSSPTLPLVRQAHQLIGKSFIEVMHILVPTQMEKAAFQIGTDQVFDLPVGRLADLAHAVPAPGPPDGGAGVNHTVGYSIRTRSQAIALLEQVQRFFRVAEPSSPVPMLCERARALAERDFMGVLRDVLPKAALKNAGADK